MDILLNHKDIVPETLAGSGKCTITGRGTVVTGRVVNGALKKGDEIQIMHLLKSV